MADLFKINVSQVEKLHQAMLDFQGDTEKTINDVLHNEANPLIQKSVQSLIPVSGRHWKGKKPPAKTSNSLEEVKENLTAGVKNTKRYGYLYFPDDGTNTRRHVGNQQFFRRGGEAVQDDIVDRCVNRLVTKLENL